MPLIVPVQHSKRIRKVASRPDGAGNVLPGRPVVPTQPGIAPQRDADAERIADVILGRPTVAANAGTDLNRKLLRAFDAADISNAEFLRLPSPRARCRLTGLSRTTLCELIERKEIRAIKVRQPGAQRGVVLIIRQSLLDYLRRLEAEQCSEATTEGGQL